jgi:hypothetical protein
MPICRSAWGLNFQCDHFEHPRLCFAHADLFEQDRVGDFSQRTVIAGAQQAASAPNEPTATSDHPPTQQDHWINPAPPSHDNLKNSDGFRVLTDGTPHDDESKD